MCNNAYLNSGPCISHFNAILGLGFRVEDVHSGLSKPSTQMKAFRNLMSVVTAVTNVNTKYPAFAEAW